MEVIVTSPVGVAGSLRSLEQSWDRLRERYTETYLQQARKKLQEQIRLSEEHPAEKICAELFPKSDLQKNDKSTVSDQYIKSNGSDGIYGMLWRLAERAGVGLRIDLKKIPVLQETIEICNTLDIDPYRLESVGALLFCENGVAATERFKASGLRYTTVIGQTSRDKKRLLLYDDVERFLTKPQLPSE